MNFMRKFWKSKKWLAFAVSVIVCIGCMILNNKMGLNIAPGALMSVLGLNALYILSQGRIDSKKANQAVAKDFFESNKFIALLIGDLVPPIIATLNARYELGLDPAAVLGLLGLDAIYILRQAAIDAKEPDKH